MTERPALEIVACAIARLGSYVLLAFGASAFVKADWARAAACFTWAAILMLALIESYLKYGDYHDR